MGTIIPLTNILPVKKHLHPADVIVGITPKDISGINVVFINMPLREESLPNIMPEGPLLMATNLRRNYGINATVIDLNAYRIQDEEAMRRGIPDGRHLTQKESFELISEHFRVHGLPDLVGLSGMITTLGSSDGKDVAKQQEVAKMVRDLAPETFLVSGNGLATELKAGLFNYIPELDAVAHSEGDDVILKICYDAAMIKRQGRKSAIASGKLEPYYLGEINNRHRMLYAGDRPRSDKKGILPNSLPYADLSILESDVFGNPIRDWYMNKPAWGEKLRNSSAVPWQESKVTPKYNAVSSRGCPHECDFCFRGSQGERLWGVRLAEHLYKEAINNYQKYGSTYIAYLDDNFGVAIPRIEVMASMFKELVAKGIRFGTHARMDEISDLRRVRPMAQAGCNYVGFGAESAHPETLKAISKGGQMLLQGLEAVKVDGRVYDFPKPMPTAIRNCLDYGIHNNLTWIAGSPGETLERLKYSVAFMRWQELLYAEHNIPASAVNKNMFSMTWYPGTDLIRHAKVRQELKRVFGINFNPMTNEPVCDDALYQYCLQLDDATKVLHGKDDEPLNFSDMDTDTILKVRELIDDGRTFDILSL